MSKDFFANKAADYENNESRVANVNAIAAAVIAQVDLQPNMHLMDFGTGTGLLLQGVAPKVGKITAVDISPSMTEQLCKKQGALPCELEVKAMDLTMNHLDEQFDGIISSMTLHHIQDVPAMFQKMHAMVKPGGFIALADLQTEDGSFHQEDTGVHHFGFSKDQLLSFAAGAGFENGSVVLASTIEKPQGSYPVLLLTATVSV